MFLGLLNVVDSLIRNPDGSAQRGMGGKEGKLSKSVNLAADMRRPPDPDILTDPLPNNPTLPPITVTLKQRK